MTALEGGMYEVGDRRESESKDTVSTAPPDPGPGFGYMSWSSHPTSWIRTAAVQR